jgi:hypothetical protein
MDYKDGDIVNGHRFDAASNSWVPVPPPAPPVPTAPAAATFPPPAPMGPPAPPIGPPAGTLPPPIPQGSPALPPPTPPKKGLSKGAKIGIGAGAGVLALFVIAAAAGSGSGGNSTASSSQSPTATTSTASGTPTPTDTASDTPSDTPSTPDLTVGQQQAVDSAQSYMSMDKGFSQKGLLAQLTSSAGEGFPKADALFAIKYLHPDWNAQAVMSAKGYLEMDKGFSQRGLMQQLTSSAGEGFTQAQAVYAINSLRPDWNAQAVMSAKGYLAMGGFSHASLLDQLTSSAGEGFTRAQALYALKKVGL